MPDLTDDKLLDLITSEAIEQDRDWWICRARIIARDLDLRDFDLTIKERLAQRGN